ncbi:adenylyl-sulfate kinase [Rhizobium deserti]
MTDDKSWPIDSKPTANVTWQKTTLDRQRRAKLLGQRPVVIWFTGLSGSGKSTIANELDILLHAEGRHTAILDGDNVRMGLNRDLGFTDADRVENMRRVAEVARLMLDAGLIVIVSFISPFRLERESARNLIDAEDFVEVFIDTPLQVCIDRDPKGLYGKAYRGEVKNFTGIDSAYEVPLAPEVHLKTVGASPAGNASEIMYYLKRCRWAERA